MAFNRLICFLAFLLCGMAEAWAGESKIPVADLTLEMKPHSTLERYYGFAEGDEMYFSFREENKLPIGEVEITEYPYVSRYKAVNIDRLKSFDLKMTKKSIFSFRFVNKSDEPRLLKINVERRPATTATRNFNPNIIWKARFDTTWALVQENYVMKRDSAAHVLVDEVSRVHSRTTWDFSDNYSVIEFTLPERTVAWSYYLGVGAEGQKTYQDALSGFLHGSAKVALGVPEIGPLVALALEGVNLFTMPGAGDNVEYWLFTDADQLKRWKEGKTGQKPIKQGNVVSASGRFATPYPGKLYLVLKNDNIRDAIDVTVKVLAVTVTEKYGTRQARKMEVTTRNMPVHAE